jgi:hypothetical protein
MIAIRVRLNSEHLCVAGASDLAVLHAIIGGVGKLGQDTQHRPRETPDLTLRVTGLTSREDPNSDEHFVWLSRSLQVGDKVEVEITEEQITDPPEQETEAEYDPDKELRQLERMIESSQKAYQELKIKIDSERNTKTC